MQKYLISNTVYKTKQCSLNIRDDSYMRVYHAIRSACPYSGQCGGQRARRWPGCVLTHQLLSTAPRSRPLGLSAQCSACSHGVLNTPLRTFTDSLPSHYFMTMTIFYPFLFLSTLTYLLKGCLGGDKFFPFLFAIESCFFKKIFFCK